MSPKLVVLDRDGVINRDSAAFIKAPAEWLPLPGSLEAIARFTQAGWRVVVATNQSGLGRGLFDERTLHAIHQEMSRQIEKAGGRLDGIYVCPHSPGENCPCRKPKPGLLHRIAADWELDLEGVPVVGDSMRDLEAAWACGARAMLVATGNGTDTYSQLHRDQPSEYFQDLAAAADALLGHG